ncbi:MAG: YdbC family protein [Saccharofermentanales bacterium]|nr:hypothetical protein [Oscillospiraceae bacterium]
MAEKKEFKYELIRTFGVLSTNQRNGWSREVNLVSWNDARPKIDIRDWAPDHSKMGKGVSMTTEEVAVLREVLAEIELDSLDE